MAVVRTGIPRQFPNGSVTSTWKRRIFLEVVQKIPMRASSDIINPTRSDVATPRLSTMTPVNKPITVIIEPHAPYAIAASWSVKPKSFERNKVNIMLKEK